MSYVILIVAPHFPTLFGYDVLEYF